jgi:Tat protein secretion system quality control protein TatD with DNase activity
MADFYSETDALRAEIAAAAARMIAEDGCDYQTAKRKAAKQILGDRKVGSDMLPDNAQIEDEVRTYNQIFFADTQPQRLLHLRKLALRMMEELEQFKPYLTGAVLNGTAGEHSDIHLHLFSESAKDVEIFLLNKNVQFEVSEVPNVGNRNKMIEMLSFMWKNEGVHLTLYEIDDMRNSTKSGGEKRQERANADTIRGLIAEESET